MADIKQIGEQCERTASREARADVLWLTKRHLEGYRAQKEYVTFLEEGIDDIYETATPMTAAYEERIGHSTEDKMSPGGRLADDETFQKSKAELKRAKRILQLLEKAINDLPNVEYTIIQLRYIETKPMPWDDVATKVRYGRRYCLKLHRRALNNVAVHLFGLEQVYKEGTFRTLK